MSEVDEAFEAYFRAKLEKLPPAKRRALSRALKNAKPDPTIPNTRNGHIIRGSLEPMPLNDISIRLNVILAGHPQSKFTLVHELRHVEDFASDLHSRYSFRSYLRDTYSRDRARALEARAFAEEYTFAREYLGGEFLEKMRERTRDHSPDEVMALFRSLGLPAEGPEWPPLQLHDVSKSEKLQRALTLSLDIGLTKTLERIMSLTQEEYVNHRLRSYDSLFAENRARIDGNREHLRRTLPYWFLFGTVTGGGVISTLKPAKPADPQKSR